VDFTSFTGELQEVICCRCRRRATGAWTIEELPRVSPFSSLLRAADR